MTCPRERKKRRSRGAWPAHTQFLNSQALPEACWCHCPGQVFTLALVGSKERQPPSSTSHGQEDPRKYTSHGRKNTGHMHGSVQRCWWVRTIGCTEEGPWSPALRGCDGDGQAGGRGGKPHAAQPLRNALCASRAGVLSASEQWEQPGLLKPPPPTFRAHSQDRLLSEKSQVSGSGHHKGTVEHSEGCSSGPPWSKLTGG